MGKMSDWKADELRTPPNQDAIVPPEDQLLWNGLGHGPAPQKRLLTSGFHTPLLDNIKLRALTIYTSFG